MDARRNRLSLKPGKSTTSVEKPWEEKISYDTDSIAIAHLRDQIVLCGYDKNAGSTSERWFVRNNSDRDIRSLTVEITYYDMSGKQLHQRDAVIYVNIPAGETRMVEVKSFDKQKNLYYYKSQPSRRASTPYDIRMRINSLTCYR
ncbi:MAG: FxLYD domain-containing protein [Muribaculaceae bacterium]|nr:FxLYD domain-containing protein [Muribaculaceae bacterium]